MNKIYFLPAVLLILSISGATPSFQQTGRTIYSNDFNPSIGVIMNGRYTSFSSATSEIVGFGIGEEGKRGTEGIGVDESEINFAASVDDKFYGSLTASLVREDGTDVIGLEEAFIQTSANAGLPSGLTLKAGRAFWTIGYLNEHHTHADDVASRPVPDRVYLNQVFNDDGIEATYVLPKDLYSEIGGGVFRGKDFPFANSTGNAAGAWSAFVRVGGDLGNRQNWRVGGYFLSGQTNEGMTNGETVSFSGDTDLITADLRYIFLPTGNSHEQELLIQAEYFKRLEKGYYIDDEIGSGAVSVDNASFGWYAQTVYKFSQSWRAGSQYSRMHPSSVPAGLMGSVLDSNSYNPSSIAIMLDWTNSEFSRIRIQYSHESLNRGHTDEQFIFQYIMSLGAHGAHKF